MGSKEALVLNSDLTWTVLKPRGPEQADACVQVMAVPMRDDRPYRKPGASARLRVGTVRVALESDAEVVTARRKGREMASLIGFAPTDAILIVAAIEELARNILRYAACGEILLKAVAGPRRGIADVALALTDGFSTSNSLGLGLPGVKRLMDWVHIRSKPGPGTTVVAWKWMAPAVGDSGLPLDGRGTRGPGRVPVSPQNPG